MLDFDCGLFDNCNEDERNDCITYFDWNQKKDNNNYYTYTLNPPSGYACKQWHLVYIGSVPRELRGAVDWKDDSASHIVGPGCTTLPLLIKLANMEHQQETKTRLYWEVVPQATLLGRVFYDADGDGKVNDGDYNSGIQNLAYSCDGSYRTQNGIYVNWEEGDSPDGSNLVNTINGSASACGDSGGPPYYAVTNLAPHTGQGINWYKVFISGLPDDWEVTAITGCDAGTNLNEGSCNVNLGFGENQVWFGVRQEKGQVTGTVYDGANYSTYGPACAAEIGGESGTVISCSGGTCDDTNQTSDSSGKYSFTDLDYGAYTFSASPPNPDDQQIFACSSSTINLASSSEELNWTLMQGVSQAWWQAVIGDVHANTSADPVINSKIPSNCGEGNLTDCQAYILTNSDDDAQKGLLSYAGGSVDAGEGSNAQSSWSLKSSYEGKTTNHEFFWNLIQDHDDLTEWDGSEPTEEINYVYSTETTINLDQDWLADYDKKTVFYFSGADADNDVELNIDSDITLAEGAFIGFIVDGYVNIARDVQSLQTVIVADGIINTLGTSDHIDDPDIQLDAQGVFVSWSGFGLGRNLGFEPGTTQDNRVYPAEKFTYLPSLIFNAPSGLKKPGYTWVEVAP